jgi:phosphoenolpyruvate carboxykinase (ATP)
MKKYIESLGIVGPKNIYHNLSPAQLTEYALAHDDGMLSATGALTVNTGKYTGRSANDKFIVDTPSVHNDIDWGNGNVAMASEAFDSLYKRITAYLQSRDLFVFDGFAGADSKYRLSVRVVNELASQNLLDRKSVV